MDENGNDIPGPLQVRVGSSEYTLVAGGSAEVEVFLTNSGPSDTFIVNILGIPPDWTDDSGRVTVWVPTGGREKVILTITPPAAAEGILGSYPCRLYVFSQSAPEKGVETRVVLSVVPQEKVQKIFVLEVESNELTAAPGAKLTIPLTLRNSSPNTELLELSVQGVPANWVSLPSPVITLPGGEEKKVDLVLLIPTAPEIRPGYFPLKISAINQKDPANKEEVDIRLGIAAFESEGPIGVMLGSVQFSAAPGGSFAIPLTVMNRGLESATFRLGVEGIPVNWVSTSTPVTPLKPGESKELALLVRPPLAPTSQAGRRKF
ncbi:MAG TPA: hypothetical protein VJ785_04470, partial [Anaerolineales bacterium]|nr:hypothetical protein [Anaerolineales bacterium]